ncbi:hypothetical protein [Mesorhizobium sp. J428]|uniref:hypothetical protein n=1 Tax=Mesorhizobium sp. J428 TaxID=2898440 RepID=UPI002151D161|nr:hypothetical protein [Mesorhizobium sp. J428]MCR5856864.1 hypothetical protein [Mesorhizobium sp. J428]
MGIGRRTLVLGIAGIAWATAAQAALPPQFQRAKELTAVVDAAAGVLGIRPIESVQRLDIDLYRVQTETCVLDVRIDDLPTQPGLVGPRKFKAVPGEPDCAQ